jgi:hypothetical protein
VLLRSGVSCDEHSLPGDPLNTESSRITTLCYRAP